MNNHKILIENNYKYTNICNNLLNIFNMFNKNNINDNDEILMAIQKTDSLYRRQTILMPYNRREK